jgi:hypothetical protein
MLIWQGDVDSRKSTTCYIYTFAGVVVSWVSRLQKVVALSTIEAEYIAAIDACKEMLWMRRFLEELGSSGRLLYVRPNKIKYNIFYDFFILLE